MNADIDRRLHHLEAHRELSELLCRYQQTTDRGDMAGWAACFVEDAVVPRSDSDIPLRGRAEIAARGAEFIAGFEARQHVIGNLSFDIDGDEATGASDLIFTGRPVGASLEDYVQFGATYRWGFRRTAEGWKIVSRDMMVVWQRPRG